MASEDSVEDYLQRALALLAVEIHRVSDFNDLRKAGGLSVSSLCEQSQDVPERPKSSLRAENRIYLPRNGPTTVERTEREWIE